MSEALPPEILESKLEENKHIEKISSTLMKVHPNKVDTVNLDTSLEKFDCLSPKIEPENKLKSRRKLKLKKRRRSPDPIINSISDLMSTSLNIVSPEKNVLNEDVKDTKQDASVELGISIDAQLDKSIEEIRLKSSPNCKRKSSSPKYLKSKFKECGQQTKLSGFVQVKSLNKEIKTNEENSVEILIGESQKTEESIRFKLSNNLFKSPRKAIKKSVESKFSCENGKKEETWNENNCQLSKSPKNSKSLENCLTPKHNKGGGKKLFDASVENEFPDEEDTMKDLNLEENQGNLKVDRKGPIKVRKAKKKRLSLKNNGEDIEKRKESVEIIESNIEQNDSNKKERSLENQETISSDTFQPEEKSSEYSKPYQMIINENSSSQSLHSLYPEEVSSEPLDHKETSSTSVHTIDTSSSLELKPRSETSPQKDVFRFMMDARHKSIGMNLDGKILENVPEEPIQETKVSLKSRRERLEEWNRSKGAIKRKLEEEAREEYVSAALDKRAKKMKRMLSIKEIKKRKVVEESDSDDSLESVEVISPRKKRRRKCYAILEETVDVETFKKVENLDSNPKVQSGLLSFFGVLSEKKSEDLKNEFKTKKEDDLKCSSNVVNKTKSEKNQENGNLVEAGVEFVKKRRGRPRKVLKKMEENQIDYTSVKKDLPKVGKSFHDSGKSENYQKTEKESLVSPTGQGLYGDSSDSFTITKNKAKVVEDSNTCFKPLNEDSNDSTTSVDSVDNKINKRSKKKTKNLISMSILKKKLKAKLDSKDSEDSVELSDDMFVPTTPRRSSRAKTSKISIDEDSMDSNETEKKKKLKKEKVAPVFANMVRPKIDPEVLKARKDFLYSGVPSTLKRIVEKQESVNNEEFDLFPVVSHVQQKPEIPSKFWNLPKVDLKLKDIEEGMIAVQNLNWNKMVDVQSSNRNIELEVPERPILSRKILDEIKVTNLEYPVYKMFRLLREKNGHKADIKKVSPRKKKRGRQKTSLVETEIVQNSFKSENSSDFAMWTEKYKPKSSEDIIGNVKCIKELKSWLDTWMEFTAEMNGRKRRRGGDSSDFETTDGESRDSLRLPGNCMLLRGPPGSGKTSAIYAICSELGINVLELNASSKRTGKRLLQELQEATQSHQVRKTDNNSLSGFLQQKLEIQIEKTKDKNKMCLLLVEDVDIVFDQDEGFISGLIQLLTTSKRPIALISSNISSNHLQKFLHYPTLNFKPLPSESLSIWLKLLCLNEGLHVSKSSLSELLNSNKGDIRKTLLQLQFWTKTGGDSKNKKNFKYLRETHKEISKFNDYLYKDDLSLNLTDQDLDCILHEDCVHSFIDFCDSPLSFPVDLAQFWWNLPDILPKPSSPEPDREPEKLFNIFKLYDALSFSDVLYREEEIPFKTELCPKRWQLHPKESLNFEEDFSSYRPSSEITHQISHSLINGYSKLEKNDPQIRINLAVPTIEQKRWRTSRFDCEEVFTAAASISSLVDRKSYSVDYFPTLRQICRTEAKRSAVNNKRNNRFYNYVKTLNVNPGANTLATACEILLKK